MIEYAFFIMWDLLFIFLKKLYFMRECLLWFKGVVPFRLYSKRYWFYYISLSPRIFK